MDSIQIKRFRAILEDRCDAFSERVHNRNVIAIESTADIMDQVRCAEERDLATRILEHDFAELRLVKAALARIEEGTYGFCLRCDQAITWNRLQVMPQAAFCVNCQEAAEHDGFSEFSLHESFAGASAAQ